jgi:hypothetical protein
MEMVSMIQAITRPSVPRSGAGMSFSGPISSAISVVKRRVSRSSSASVSVRGSQTTPPLAPPKGRSTSAAFQVMNMARARQSSRVMAGW